MTYVFFLFLLLCIAWLSCTTTVINDKNDEFSKRSAHIYNPDHSPAVNVPVNVFAAGDTSRIPVYQTTTGESGEYSIRSMDGEYNVMSGNDSLGAYQDSVVIKSTYSTLADDTLHNTGLLLGVVKLQPMDDPRTVTVQILGTDKYSNVSSDGSFAINGLPPGKYALRASTTLPEYTLTLNDIAIEPSVHDTTRDTISLIYTGIPVVLNLHAEYDTIFGVIRLSWDTLEYSGLRDFLIYRDADPILSVSTQPVATVAKCSYSDTINSAFSDSTTALTYRVAVRTNTFGIGKTYNDIKVTVFHTLSISLSNSMQINLGVPYTITPNLSGYTGSNAKYEWDIGNKGIFTVTTKPETTFILHDTLTDDFQCVFRFSYANNRKTILDTAHLRTGINWIKIAPSLDDSFHGAYNSVVYNNRLFVFGDNWWNKLKMWESDDGSNWRLTSDSLPIPCWWSSKPIVFMNRICIVDSLGFLWTFTDLVGWSKTSNTPIFNTLVGPPYGQYDSLQRLQPTIFVDGNKIILQIRHSSKITTLVSSDLVNWDSASGYQAVGMIKASASLNNSFMTSTGASTRLRDSSGYSDILTPSCIHPYIYPVLVTFIGTFIYSVGDGDIWAFKRTTPPTWYNCSNPWDYLSPTIPQISLIAFKNDLYMVTTDGIYKTYH